MPDVRRLLVRLPRLYGFLRKLYHRLFFAHRITTATCAGTTRKFFTPTPTIAEHVRSLTDEGPVLETFLEHLHEREVVWDVGAGFGLYALFAAARIRCGGTVQAFEPEPGVRELLIRNLALNHAEAVSVHPFALGDRDGEAGLFASNSPNIGTSALVQRKDYPVRVDATPVVLCRGDTLIARGLVPRPAALKIDVEGAEASVLSGLTNALTLGSVRLICCEVHPRLLPLYGSSADHFESRLKQFGFSVLFRHTTRNGVPPSLYPDTMTLIPIQSFDLPQLLPYRTLRRQEAHKAEGIFVAEGEKVVQRLLESGLEMVSMLVSTARAERLSTRELPAELPVYVAGDALLQTITGFRMHQGLMAVGRIPPEPELALALPSMARPRLLAALDGITQAENVGVTVRNCAAFDVQGVLVGGTCCSPWLRRAVRSSMGGVFLVPVIHTGDLHSALRVLQEGHSVQVVVTDPDQGEDISTIDFRRDTCLVFGEEQSGVSEGIMSLADSRARIPMREGVDSLNVSSAGAVALYEVHRQRRMAPGSPASLAAGQ